jgi:hypothetical protein
MTVFLRLQQLKLRNLLDQQVSWLLGERRGREDDQLEWQEPEFDPDFSASHSHLVLMFEAGIFEDSQPFGIGGSELLTVVFRSSRFTGVAHNIKYRQVSSWPAT